MPAPVGPQTATISPGAASRSIPESTSPPVGYAKRTASKRTGSGPSGSDAGCSASGQRLRSRRARRSSARLPRVARWPRLMIQPSASSGHTSWRSSVMKSVNWPIVRFPAIASRPPTRSTAAIAERGEEDEAGEEARLDRRLAHRLVAHGLGPVAEAVAHVVLAAERLHHLDPDDGLVGGLGEVALLPLHLARDREHAVREEVGEDGDRRHRDGRRERELPVHDREHDRGADQHQHALDRLHDAPADEVAHGVDVVRRPRDAPRRSRAGRRTRADSGGTPRRASSAAAPRR